MRTNDRAGQKDPARTGATPTTIPDGGRTVTYADLSDFQRDLLFAVRALERRDVTPTDDAILDALEDEDCREVRTGQLYPNLHELHALDFLEEHEADDDGEYHELTDDGLALLREHVEQAAELLGIPIVLDDDSSPPPMGGDDS